MGYLYSNSRVYRSCELDRVKISALNSKDRINILERLADQASYPAEVSEELGIGKQKTYYHFRKLEEAGIIEEVERKDFSGGTASIYSPSQESLHFLTAEGERWKTGIDEKKARAFLDPLVKKNRIEGTVVVGSPDQHGPDQVRARDGHLAGEVNMVLGRYSYSENRVTFFDTEISRNKSFERNILTIGGVLTNTVTKKFNQDFPVVFTGDNFPYRRLESPDGEIYKEPDVGVVQRAQNPMESSKKIFMLAGVRGKGTEAAVTAFRELEKIIDEEGMEDYYIIKGLDMDGDGVIDDYKVL